MATKLFDNREFISVIVKPLSLLLCSGNGLLSKTIIEFNKMNGYEKEAAAISHVARVIQNPFVLDYPDLWVYEATTHNKWCNKKGVQVNPFHKWLAEYDGKVWTRTRNSGQIGHCNASDIITATHVSNHLSTPYESGIKGLIELIKTGKRIPQKEDYCGIHCSELDTHLSIELGDTHPWILSNGISPAEHWTGGKYDRTLSKHITYLLPARIK